MTAAIIEAMAYALTLTIIFELVFSLLCKIRGRRNFIIIVLVNVLTNPLVNAIHHAASADVNGIMLAAVTAVLEIAAVITEGMIYKAMTDIKKPMLFSLGANMFSFGLGLIIGKFI